MTTTTAQARGSAAAGDAVPLSALRLRLLVVWGVARGLWRWWSHRSVRDHALTRASELVRGTHREAEARSLARRQTVELAVEWSLARRFHLLRRVPVQGLEHLARPAGQGAVVVTAHCGWLMALPWRLVQEGQPTASIIGGWWEHGRTPWDRRQQPILRDLVARGGELVVTGRGAFAEIARHVADGGLGLVAVDMPGSLPVRYLGKATSLGQAAFRISWDSGAPLVPAFVRRSGTRIWIEVCPPLRPERHQCFEAFAATAVDAVSSAVLAHAEHASPRIPGFLWPGGDWTKAEPNRATWAKKLDGGSP